MHQVIQDIEVYEAAFEAIDPYENMRLDTWTSALQRFKERGTPKADLLFKTDEEFRRYEKDYYAEYERVSGGKIGVKSTAEFVRVMGPPAAQAVAQKTTNLLAKYGAFDAAISVATVQARISANVAARRAAFLAGKATMKGIAGPIGWLSFVGDVIEPVTAGDSTLTTFYSQHPATLIAHKGFTRATTGGPDGTCETVNAFPQLRPSMQKYLNDKLPKLIAARDRMKRFLEARVARRKAIDGIGRLLTAATGQQDYSSFAPNYDTWWANNGTQFTGHTDNYASTGRSIGILGDAIRDVVPMAGGAF